jgi:hypothetical protein
MVEGMKIPGTSRRCGAGPGGLVHVSLAVDGSFVLIWRNRFCRYRCANYLAYSSGENLR